MMNTYYAVIFPSQRKEHDKMIELARLQPGFIRVEGTRDHEGHDITVSYWKSLEAIQKWEKNTKHLKNPYLNAVSVVF